MVVRAAPALHAIGQAPIDGTTLFGPSKEQLMIIDIHHPALLADLVEIAAAIRALKRLLRGRWTRPMAEEQRALHALKQRATDLYALLAFAHGRFHLQRAPRGAPSDWDALIYHQRIAERLGPSYTLALSESA